MDQHELQAIKIQFRETGERIAGLEARVDQAIRHLEKVIDKVAVLVDRHNREDQERKEQSIDDTMARRVLHALKGISA